ncbi:MAG: Na+/H+ antiporter subunit E [Chloroflexi bacterium]|nr:Na+/H+ antiporter subunit E [Chloroflexota bacterium]
MKLKSSGKVMILALPLAIGWTIYTAQPTPGNLLLGYLFSVSVLIATGIRGESVRMRNAPRQLYNLFAYTLYLASEVLSAGLKVSRVILMPSLPISPGIATVNTQDSTENELISAVSAHGITITPGELVVDFEETSEEGVKMIVHSLNLDSSGQSLDEEQQRRLMRIKGILGHD